MKPLILITNLLVNIQQATFFVTNSKIFTVKFNLVKLTNSRILLKYKLKVSLLLYTNIFVFSSYGTFLESISHLTTVLYIEFSIT